MIPNLLVSGVLTVLVAAALAVWAIAGMHARHGALVLIGLSVLLLAVWGTVPEVLVYGLMVLAFGGVILALVAARAHDMYRQEAAR